MRSTNPTTVYDTRASGFDQARTSRAGRLLWSAGIVGWDVSRRFVGDGGFHDQVAQALCNAAEICRSAGATLADAVQIRFFVVGDAAQAIADIQSALAAVLERPFPPLTLVGVSSLADPLLRVEIELVVDIPPPRSPT